MARSRRAGWPDDARMDCIALARRITNETERLYACLLDGDREGAASCNLRINRFAWQIVDRARGVDGEA